MSNCPHEHHEDCGKPINGPGCFPAHCGCPGPLSHALMDLPRFPDLPLPGKSPGPARRKLVALCVPMYRDLSYETFDCIDHFRAEAPPAGWGPVNFQPGKSHPAFYTRECIVENVLSLEKEHGIRHDVLLWVDSDNGLDHPERLWDVVLRLDMAPEKIQVLGVPCRMRGFPEERPNIDAYHDPSGNVLDVAYHVGGGVAVPTHPSRPTPARPFLLVRRIGFGIVAMRRSLFDVLERPWFETLWAHPLPPGGKPSERLVGEDMGFCDRVRKNGLFVAADFGLSADAWHLFEEKKKLSANACLDYNAAAAWGMDPSGGKA